ncbi:precorrin-2 C(20)-methyltransferase [Ahrensia sp. R2A130]|uniref:precorrin-2 C(20)-methyltransferase n=1 Tax=Ahrensia sp. R2A130 TaxID=744979 RepID=UPI0001E0AC65|nr:precorrin-2 C(20)-methyltransferase [Ahrensia sp. R2A130]EFL90682.1 precorrin-2 C20-methyltransferase [Ahrensia sp. R2A130]
MTGTLYGLGVGPGDPELLTLKSHRILTSSPVVAYPAPDDGVSFARSIVAEFLHNDQVEFPIIVPMRVERFPAKDVYDQAALGIASHLDSGRDVAVLCEGDPFFYGSFMYLYERLAGRYPVQTVPGVSSLMASAARLGRPLAARNDVLTVVPGPSDDDTIRGHLQSGDALAFIKVGRHLERLCGLIAEAGLTGQAAYLERVTLPAERITPLSDVPEGAAPYFSIILLYRGAEDWITRLPVASA